jgi:hypothetical protein
VLVLIDACRAIASFVLTDDNGLNVVRTGIAADGRFADGVNGMIGYAAQPGKAALGTSISGKPSIFTSSLSAHVDSVGADFGVVFKTVSAEVGMVTSDSQAPSLLDWSQSQLFLNPTPQIVEVWKTLWMNALASGDWARVARYARQFATSNYAAAARKWLADHPRPTLAASYTAVSPAAVEASWSGSDASIAVRPNAIGVGFNRVLDVSQMPLLAALSATELGADEHGRAGEVAAEVRGDVATAVAHREVVTLRAFAARAAPSSFSSIVYDVQPGTSIRVLGITSTDATGSWVAARLSSDNPVIYMKMKAVEERPSALQLGRALVELDVPLSSTGVRGAIEDTVISKAIRRLQEQGKLITWASLATGPASGPFGSDINESMIMHAEGALKRSGLSGRRITSVSSSQDYQKTGVRVRVFGWDP